VFADRYSNPPLIHNERLREAGKSFSDAICEVPFTSNIENGAEILETIKRAGR
jgi:hypothetical protein